MNNEHKTQYNNKRVRICILLMLFLLFTRSNFVTAEEKTLFEVTELKGSAYAAATGRSPTPIKTGDHIAAKDRIRTGPGSSISLRLPSSAEDIVRIGENSAFAILVQEAGMDIELTQGDVSVELGKLQPGSAFTVTTPISVCSVYGAVFRIVHRADETSAWVFNGTIELSAFDHGGIFKASTTKVVKNHKAVISGKDRTISTTSFDPGNIKKDALSPADSAKPAEQKPMKVAIQSTNKAYYVTPSCDLKDNVSTCPESSQSADSGEEADQAGGEPEIDLEDFGMLTGDEIDLSRVRALLPYTESSLVFSHKRTHFEFYGTMMVCAALTPDRKAFIKLFQAGRVKPEIRSEKDGTHIKFKSENYIGIKQSTINVSEGLVAVTIPTLCRNCTDKMTAMVEAGKCWNFSPTTKAVDKDKEDDELDFELPPIETEPQPTFDPTGSTD